MNSSIRILAFSGSTRRHSFNQALVGEAARGARDAGATVTLVSLSDYPMPLYDEDLETESGLPPAAQRLRALFLEHDALLIASPEYNASCTGVLKNALDWVSRPQSDGHSAFRGKLAAVMATSSGSLGGLRGLAHLRDILTDLGTLVLPRQIALGPAERWFHPDGSMRESDRTQAVRDLGGELARVTQDFSGQRVRAVA